MKPPPIKIEIIHIDGPLKGTIQEFYDTPISIGRHPDCQVCFPKDLTTISRKHAEIVRDGNRFLITDQSTNGTLVNGKQAENTYLRDGDIMTISENGPKISFISTTLGEGDVVPAGEPAQPEPQPVYTEPVREGQTSGPPSLSTRSHYPEETVEPPEPSISADINISTPAQPTQDSVEQEVPAQPEPQIQTTRNPFVIQFGVMLKSYDTLPITVGGSPDCDFVIDHPAIMVQHAQIFFSDKNYYIKDLTGRNLITINGIPVADSAILLPDTCLSLSNQGPHFQFLGDGRLAEIEQPGQTGVGQTTADSASSPQDDQKSKYFWPFKK